MNLMTVNAGSSSIRLALFAMEAAGPRQLAEHHAEHDGVAAATQLRTALDAWPQEEVTAVIHRIVHGGARLVQACVLDDEVENEIARLADLAPLHHPQALAWIAACREKLGDGVAQLAVFDTAFFAGLPEVATTYALPRDLCARHGLRRYGFHGLAHQAMWRRWCTLGNQDAEQARVISVQLGAGCSIAAIRHGRPVDTSMGFSPLEGLVMATRCGDVDPGLLTFLQRAEGIGAQQLEQTLNHESGLLGLSGTSGDMRQLLAASDGPARLAVDVYCYRVRKYIGAYLAALSGADAILFGGGVGEHAAAVRHRILAGMQWCGIELDEQANAAMPAREARISVPNNPIEVWVIPVDEAAEMASEAAGLLQATRHG